MMGQQATGPLILASTSKWRRGILEAAGIPCVSVAPEVEEAGIVGMSPPDTAHLRALAKAQDVAARYPGRWVMGADQVVHLDGASIGKPQDEHDWFARLSAFRGRTHQLTTAVVLVNDGIVDAFAVDSRVRFRADIEASDLKNYIRFGEAAGCAGGYMVEGRGAWLVASVDGDWTNVVGLPIFAVVEHLRRHGWRLGADGVASDDQR